MPTIQFRRGDAITTRVLAEAEPAFVLPAVPGERGRFVIGDGVTEADDLPDYAAGDDALDLEAVQDAVNTMVVAGAGISKAYNDTLGTLTLTSTVALVNFGAENPAWPDGTIWWDEDYPAFTIDAGSVTIPAAQVTGLAEVVRDTMGTALVAGSNMTVTPNDGADTITLAATAGGSVDAETVRDTMATALVAGSNVTITPNDGADTITISASLTPGAGNSPFNWKVATASPYNMATGNSASANTTALKACMNAAIAAKVGVFIPAGTYMVNPGCLTPSPGSNAKGTVVRGEGMFLTNLQMATQASPGYFYDNIGAPTTLSMAHFEDIGFIGGPTDTPAQRIAVNANHRGFRLEGMTDQSFRFERCRFATMAKAFHTIGNNNADVSVWINCRFMHISEDVFLFDNQQTVNMNCIDSPMDVIWGNVFHTINSDGLGGGGAFNIIGGHIIVQRNGGRGCLVKLDYIQSSMIGISHVRCEVRNDAIAVDGTANGGIGSVMFTNSTLYTTESTGTIRLVDIAQDQSVVFTACTFESNGADQDFRVRNSGRLHFRDSGVRSNLQSRITVDTPGTVASSGTAIARDCWPRFSQGLSIDFTI
jgi:hypothetical protein